jgi:hypothetical protein
MIISQKQYSFKSCEIKYSEINFCKCYMWFFKNISIFVYKKTEYKILFFVLYEFTILRTYTATLLGGPEGGSLSIATISENSP